MSPLRVCVEIDAPAERVWFLIAEFKHWPIWGPSIRSVRSSARAVAPGVSGRVRTVFGFKLPFLITKVDPGREWAWSVAGIAATGHTVEPISDSQCVACFTVSRLFTPYGWVLRRGLRKLKDLSEEEELLFD